MEQVYIIRKTELSESDKYTTRRQIFFRFGEWCYHGSIDLGYQSINLSELRLVMPVLQRMQGQLRSACEFGDLPPDNLFRKTIEHFRTAAAFIIDEILNSEEKLQKISSVSGGTWVNDDEFNTFFELETAGPQFEDTEMIAGKVYLHSILLHLIYYQGTYYAVLADAGVEQPLLDTHFPDVSNKVRSVEIDNYDHHDTFKSLSLCLSSSSNSSSDTKNVETSSTEEEERESAATAVYSAEARRSKKPHGSGAYNQTYIILEPPSPEILTSMREVFFRFGNWCYHGSAGLGFNEIGLAQLPIVMPRLHQQQHRLQSTCEYATLPHESKFKKFLSEFNKASLFIEEEVISSEEKLGKLVGDGAESWIDDDFSNVFFELTIPKNSVDPYPGVEMIAAKTYTRSVVLHTMYYKRSYYCVINDASVEQPLLDTYFPDVSKKTSDSPHIEIMDYGSTSSKKKYSKLKLWSGRSIHITADLLVKNDGVLVESKEMDAESVDKDKKADIEEEGKESIATGELTEREEGESKVDIETKKRKEKALAIKRMKQLNFVRAPHHVKPIDGLNNDKMKEKLRKLNASDPFATKKVLGGK